MWIPINRIFDLGTPGPSGNEHDTYVKGDTIFKVNNLLNVNIDDEDLCNYYTRKNLLVRIIKNRRKM